MEQHKSEKLRSKLTDFCENSDLHLIRKLFFTGSIFKGINIIPIFRNNNNLENQNTNYISICREEYVEINA